MIEWLNELFREALFLPEQATRYARSVDFLHYLQMTSMVSLSVLVAIVVSAFCVRYRQRRAAQTTPRIVAPLRLELPVYGGILAFFVGLWWMGFQQYREVDAAPEDALDVYVTGKQWMWKFAYADAGIGSVNVLYVPAGRPVRLLLTSRDVIHSWFVPELRLKRDAVPGMYTSLWFEVPAPGRYPILCAELCGVGHSQMLGELVVLAQPRFDDWIARRRSASGLHQRGTDTESELAERGRAVAAEHGCLVCHGISEPPPGVEPIGPSWVGLFGAEVPLLGGGTATADASYLTRSMMDPAAEIHEGFAPVMPSYRGQLDAAEVAALVELIQSLAQPAASAAPDSARAPTDPGSPGRTRPDPEVPYDR